MRQGHEVELTAIESDSKSTIEFYRQTAPDKFREYFKFCDKIQDEFTGEMFSELRSFMNKSRGVLGEY